MKLKPKPQVVKPTNKVVVGELPELVELDPKDARPAILLQGASGTGKTYALSKLLDRGYNALILAVEPKVQQLAKYRPQTLFFGAPTQDGKLPTVTQVYDRLFYFVDALAAGKYRDHNGKPFDIIATDGFLELGTIIYKYWKKKNPLSDSTGKQNTFALWDNVAERAVDFFQAMRNAAGYASTQFGLPPVGVAATVGEEGVEKSKFGGDMKYVPLFPGQKAGKLLPYQFEQTIRLEVRLGADRQREFVAHTVGTEEFEAKCPEGLFEAEVINPDFGEMYEKLVEHYQIKTGEVKKDE